MKEMSDQVRGILFVIVSLLILFAWGHFYKPPVTPPETHTTQAPSSAAANPAGTPQTPAKPEAEEKEKGSRAHGRGATAHGKEAEAAAAANAAVVEAREEKTVVVQSPLYRVELSNRGGVVKTWELKKYMNDEKPPRPLDLVNDSVAKELGWPFSVVMADAQLEAKANAGLYEIETHVVPTDVPHTAHLEAGNKAPSPPPASDAGLFAPIEVDMHWSDGHLDVTKKLKFDLNYEVTVEVAATLDGKPEPVAVAWRGGFGDKAVYNAAQLLTVFYKTGGKLNLLQYKKLGVSGNQSQPAVQYGPLEFTGIEDQFFTAAFLPDGTDVSLWHWMQNHTTTGADGKQTTVPEAEMAAGTDGGCAFARASVRGAERIAATGRAASFARRIGEFWIERGPTVRVPACAKFAIAAATGGDPGHRSGRGRRATEQDAMSVDGRKLLDLMPALYRLRDAQVAQSGNLLSQPEAGALRNLQSTPPPLKPTQQQQFKQLLAKASRGPLQSLLMLIGSRLAILADDLDQLYDDQFIETCAPWVIPYIGDLIGYQPVQRQSLPRWPARAPKWRIPSPSAAAKARCWCWSNWRAM